MAGIRQTTRKSDGKPHPKYRFWFIDHEDRRRWGRGTQNKTETLQIARQLESEHLKVRLGFSAPPESRGERRNYSDATQDYLAWGKTQGGRNGRPWGEKHAPSRRRHLPFWGTSLDLEEVADLEGKLPRVERALQDLLAGGRTRKTPANYRESICSFCSWAVRRGYLESDPLKNLRPLDSTPETTRRAFTAEEITALLEVAPGPQKLLYAVAVSTGLRTKELRSLRVRHLDTVRRGLILDAEWTKNRRDAFQPLPSELAQELQALAALRASEGALLEVPSHTARTMDKDLRKAGIAKHTAEGKVDFHALRVAYTTLVIEAGATVKEA